MQLNTPDSASAQLKFTVTLLLFQPLALAVGETDPAMVGGFGSMLNVCGRLRVTFPALSVALIPVFTFAPKPLTTKIPGQVCTPDRASEQDQFTVTLELYQFPTKGGGEV